eukprot:3578746-Prorocentrum_lima.AAC.1
MSLALCNACLHSNNLHIDLRATSREGEPARMPPPPASLSTSIPKPPCHSQVVGVKCCSSVDCPNYYERHQAHLQQLDAHGM